MTPEHIANAILRYWYWTLQYTSTTICICDVDIYVTSVSHHPLQGCISLLSYIKGYILFLHISSELKLILAVKMSPQWKSDLISPLWQVSWCTWFIVFNLHSQVAYQAADRQREMETPHISSADCASHFATCLTFKEACHELHRVGLNPCSLRRHFWNKEALRGLACQPVHPPMFLLFPAWSLYSIFFQHVQRLFSIT